MKKHIVLAVATVFASLIQAANTEFSGSGNWSETAKWDNGLPGAGDNAYVGGGAKLTINGDTINVGQLVPKNNASVVAVNNADITLTTSLAMGTTASRTVSMAVTNSSVSAKDSNFGTASGCHATYLQKGGSYTSTGNFNVSGVGAALVSFDGSDTSFSGSPLVVGRGDAGAFLSFANGAFSESVTCVRMGIGANATGRMAFSNETVRMGGSEWTVGWNNSGAAEPSLATFEDSVIDQGAPMFIGRGRDGAAGKGLVVAADGTWTNSSGRAILLGHDVSGSSGHLVLSNCAFRTSPATSDGANFFLGNKSSATGRLDVIGGRLETDTDGTFDVSKVKVGSSVGGIGVLALHGFALSAWPTYQFTDGSDSTLELVDCSFTKTDFGRTVGDRKNGVERVILTGGTFNLGSPASDSAWIVVGRNNSTDGGTSEGEFEIDGSDVTCGRLLVGRNSYHPGRLLLRNGAVLDSYNVQAGIAGTAVGAITNLGATVYSYDGVWLGRTSDANVFYRDGEGSLLASKSIAMPEAGTMDAQIGGRIDTTEFYIGKAGNSATFSGTVTVVDGASITATNAFFVGRKTQPGVATLELKGGTVRAPYVRRNNGSGTNSGTLESYVYFNGGMLKAYSDQSSEWIDSGFTRVAVSDGGAILDSDGHTVTASAAIAHDPREGAAAKDGGLVKKGAGTVKFTGALTFNGDIRVEAGTLDLSRATYAMGASAGLSGSGTLMAPDGGLTVGGDVTLDAASPGTLTVDGDLTFGPNSTVVVKNAESLDRETAYTVLTATSITGTPALVGGLRNGWNVSVSGNALRLSYCNPTTIIMR